MYRPSVYVRSQSFRFHPSFVPVIIHPKHKTFLSPPPGVCLGFPKIPRQLLNSEHLSRMCISIHFFHPFPLRTFPTLSLYHFHSIKLVNHIHAFSCTHTTQHFVLFYLCCVFVVIKRCSPLLYHGCPWRLVRTFSLASPRLQARASGCGV